MCIVNNIGIYLGEGMENNLHNENISISQYSDPVEQGIREVFEEYKNMPNNMANQIIWYLG